MNDILEKIIAARQKYFREKGNQPNLLYLNMADYKMLCDAVKSLSGVEAYFDGGALKSIWGLCIKKRAGEIECGRITDDHITKEHLDAARSVNVLEDAGYMRREAPEGMKDTNILMTAAEYKALEDDVVKVSGQEISFEDALKMEGVMGDYARHILKNMLGMIRVP